MRILIAVHHFPPRYTGGAELRARRTAHYLQSKGHEVAIICVEDPIHGPADRASWTDDVFEGLHVRRLAFSIPKAKDPARWEYDNPLVADHLQSFLRDVHPDIFHMFSGYMLTGSALRVASAMRIPTVLTLTDYWFLCPRMHLVRSNGEICSTLPADEICAQCLGEERRRYRIPARILPAFMRGYWKRREDARKRMRVRRSFLLETLACADRIISPSRFLRGFFIDAGVPEETIRFLRQGRDFPQLSAEDLRKEPSSTFRVGYIGQLAWHKGVHVLFEAALRIPGVPLTIYVYGERAHFPRYAEKLDRYARRDGRLKLEGTFRPGQLGRVMKGLDVVVVPSLWFENSPNVILEAFAYETPVIVSDLGGMAELVEHEVNGLRFRVGDPDDLALQLRRVIEEPGLLDHLRKGIPRVKTIEEEMNELLALYADVMAEYSPPLRVA